MSRPIDAAILHLTEMMRMAEISVVMATYNGARFVREQVSSLLEQTQLPAELVVADDGSTDGTLGIVRDALAGAPFPVRLYANPERKGFRRNFIEAASCATASLVAFCDQDDVWRPDKLARMAQMFDDPNVMLAYHNAVITDLEGRITGQLYAPDGGRKRSESSRVDPWSSSLGFTQVFRRDLISLTPLHMISRDFLFSHEILAHDQWFFFLATSFGRVAFLNENLVAYRQHESNVFGAVDRGRARRLGVIRATLDHSGIQVASRGSSLSSKVAIFNAIAADETQDGERRTAAVILARHHEELEALYATRVKTYNGSFPTKIATWLRLMAKRRYLADRGLSYPARHAARDLAFGVLFGHLAAAPR